MNIFTYPLKFFGLTAPWFSWVAAIVLVIWPFWELFELIRIYKRQEKICKKLIFEIEKVNQEYPVHGSHGLSLSALDRLQSLFEKNLFLTRGWNNFRKKLIFRPSLQNKEVDEVWAPDSAVNFFSEQTFLGDKFNIKRFQAIPGIVTGFGLLMTFAAILVGLLDVRIEDNRVQGLQNLIGGLSGKFISSVAALLSASVFLISEKIIFHRLSAIQFNLITAVDNVFPRRSEVKILEEISINITEQTMAFRIFNSDLSFKLKDSFNESIGPTLERMVSAIDNLNQLTRSTQSELLEGIREMNRLLLKTEETKQESISEQVGSLLKQLQLSLTTSIERMSREFSGSLTGTTDDHFRQVAKTVEATAQVLEKTNKQFGDNQLALQDLISLAKQSTEAQLNTGSTIIDKMAKELVSTMANMEQKIMEISSNMTNTIQDTAEKSATAAGEIIDEVRNLNTQSVEKLLDVLHKHDEQQDKIESLKKGLVEAVEEFGEYVTGYNQMNHDLGKISQDLSGAMASLSKSTVKLGEVEESFFKVADFSKNQVQSLGSSQERQQELWKNINYSMEHYKKTFENVETGAAGLLSQIKSHLDHFIVATNEHFNNTVSVANDHINKAVGLLGDSIMNLEEKLEDLSDSVSEIDKIISKLKR